MCMDTSFHPATKSFGYSLHLTYMKETYLAVINGACEGLEQEASLIFYSSVT